MLPRVLIVSEDPTIRATVARMLGPSYTCDSVPSGASALARVRESAFELCVVEIEMAWMDGVAFARELAARGDAIPTILVGAAPDARLRTPVVGVVAHPLWASELLPLVARAVPSPAAAVGRVRVSLRPPPR